MKILHLVADGSLMGGISRHVQNISLEMLRQRRVEVAVCTIYPPDELNRSVAEAGGRSFSLDARNYSDINVFRRFARIVKDYKPDIIHVHVIVFWQWLYLATFGRHCRVVRTIHSLIGGRSFVKRLFQTIFPLPVRQHFFVSNAVKQRGEEIGLRGVVIYNPAPQATSKDNHNLHAILGIGVEQKIVGTACKITAVKQPEVFTRVMAQVLICQKDVHAVVIGDGPNNPIDSLKTIVEKYGVIDRFHFLGYRDDAKLLISDFDVFIMTSEHEGMPTTFVEAIAAGIPFAFMNGNGGLLDLKQFNHCAEGPVGIDVEAGDEHGLIDGICAILTNANFARLCSEHGKRLCNKYFNLAQVVKQLLQTYQEVACA